MIIKIKKSTTYRIIRWAYQRFVRDKNAEKKKKKIKKDNRNNSKDIDFLTKDSIVKKRVSFQIQLRKSKNKENNYNRNFVFEEFYIQENLMNCGLFKERLFIRSGRALLPKTCNVGSPLKIELLLLTPREIDRKAFKFAQTMPIVSKAITKLLIRLGIFVIESNVPIGMLLKVNELIFAWNIRNCLYPVHFIYDDISSDCFAVVNVKEFSSNNEDMIRFLDILSENVKNYTINEKFNPFNKNCQNFIQQILSDGVFYNDSRGYNEVISKINMYYKYYSSKNGIKLKLNGNNSREFIQIPKFESHFHLDNFFIRLNETYENESMDDDLREFFSGLDKAIWISQKKVRQIENIRDPNCIKCPFLKNYVFNS